MINKHLHTRRSEQRIAQERVGTPFPGDISDAVVYNLEDQIGSSVTRLNTSGSVIDKEEYYPFGDSSLRTFSSKRYRYCGKEKDSESGLYYYGARYYASWTCRFISVDPLAGKYNFWSSYVYAGNNPITLVDINGEGPEGGGDGGDNGVEAGGSSGNNGASSIAKPTITIIVNAGEAPTKPNEPECNLNLLRETFEKEPTSTNFENLKEAENQWNDYTVELAEYKESLKEYNANKEFLEKIKSEIETSDDPVLSLQREKLNGKTITIETSEYIELNGERLAAGTYTYKETGEVIIRFDRKLIESGVKTDVTKVLSELRTNLDIMADLTGLIIHELGHVISNNKVPLEDLDNHSPKSELDAARWEAYYYRIKHDLTVNFGRSREKVQHLNFSISEYENVKKGF